MDKLVIMPEKDYKDICDAVRAKTGGTELLKSGDLPAQIEGISGGGGEKILYMDAALLNAGGPYPANADDYTTAIIPAEATYVSLDVFDNLPNVTKVIVNGDAEFETITEKSNEGKSTEVRNALYFQSLKGKLSHVVVNDRASVPANFLYCAYSLKTLELNNCVSIGDHAIKNCYTLNSLTMQNNTDNDGSFGYSAIYYCHSLQNLEVGRGYTKIGAYFGGYCSNLKNVVFSEDVSEISSNWLYNCRNVETVTILCDTATIDSAGYNLGANLTSGTVFRGHAGSTIEAWAAAKGKTFEVIE